MPQIAYIVARTQSHRRAASDQGGGTAARKMCYGGRVDAAAASEHALCAAHTDRAAVATCARCGSFMCDACRSEAMPSLCIPCVHRLEQGRFVSQVPIFAIVMMVHGALMVGVGLIMLISGVVLGVEFLRTSDEALPGDPVMSGFVFGMFGIIALTHVVPGLLQLRAGYRLRSFRSRTLGLVALSAGVATVFGCYCAPTSIALLIWGVVVLANRDVIARFAASSGSDT